MATTPSSASRVLKILPPFLSFVAIASMIAITWLLSWHASDGSRDGDKVTSSTTWLIWRCCAAASIVLFVTLFQQGITQLCAHRSRPTGAQSPPTVGLALLAVATVSLSGWAVALGAGSEATGLTFPIDAIEIRTGVVVAAGAISATPWLMNVWLVNADCRGILAKDDDFVADTHAEAVEKLLGLWKVLMRCVAAFVVLVVAAVITTGALRAVFVEAFPTRAEEFPSSHVLIYGAALGVLLAVICIPMISRWRSCAFQVLESALPVPKDLKMDESWTTHRANLRSLLMLDMPLLRLPFLALGVFAPVVISLLAVFIPELAP